MIVAVFSLCSRIAHAYIPKARVILEKVGKQHGKGTYLVQQEVALRDERGSIVLIEEWLVENGESMSLVVKGAGNQAHYIYKDRQKFFLDEKGAERSDVVSREFFEPVFYYRGWDNLAEFLFKEKILPTKNLAREVFSKESKEFQYQADPFVRLSRTAGVIAFALGKPTPADSSKTLPGIWVEQDRFLIRRLRLESQSEVTADDYSEYSNGLWFPKNRTVTWADKAVSMRVIKVSGMSSSESVKSRLSSSALRSKKGEVTKEFWTSPTVAEFYKRFR
jgi:hypothetical protein